MSRERVDLHISYLHEIVNIKGGGEVYTNGSGEIFIRPPRAKHAFRFALGHNGTLKIHLINGTDMHISSERGMPTIEFFKRRCRQLFSKG